MGCPMYISPEEDPIQHRQTQLSEIKGNLEEMISIAENLIYEQGFLVHGNRGGLLMQLSDIVENLEEMIVIVESLLDGQETRVQDNRDWRPIQRRYDLDWDWESEIERGMPELLEPGW